MTEPNELLHRSASADIDASLVYRPEDLVRTIGYTTLGVINMAMNAALITGLRAQEYFQRRQQ